MFSRPGTETLLLYLHGSSKSTAYAECRRARDSSANPNAYRLLGPLACQRPLAHQTPQDLSKFHIKQMNGVQGILARVDTLLYALSGWRDKGTAYPSPEVAAMEPDEKVPCY
jgi:hypothetical protein